MKSEGLFQELAPAIDRETLRRMAGMRAYERGAGYFENGRVGPLVVVDGVIEAEVSGSDVYRARLWRTGKQLDYSCTCPVGTDGEFCKHVVALGLACLTPQRHVAPPAKPRRTAPKVNIRSHLESQSKEQLIDLLLEHAEINESLRQRLHTDAASRPGRRVNLATFHKAIDSATNAGGFVSYGEMHGYARGIDEVADSIERLAKTGDASAVIELTEYALAAVERAMESVDDSDGTMGGILDRLQAIHHAACVKAKPDQESLARRLFDWELRTDWDTFYGAAKTYADVFGEAGLRVYRERAKATWSRVPALKPGDSRGAASFVKRFRITSIMETLAIESGVLDALVAVKERDLSLPYSFLQIAEIYRDAKQRDLALEWAERGLREFKGERQDSRLREFLANEYHARKRHDEAMALVWAAFTESPDLDEYRKLKTHAERGSNWNAWRDKALAHLRQRATPARPPPAVRSRWAFMGRADRSTLVRVFLWEKDVGAAWAEAQAGGCSDALWMELATLRETEHPGEVLAIYQQQVERTVSGKSNQAYRDTVALLRKVRRTMVSMGNNKEFPHYLESVRAAHKAKRNFVKLIDHARWS